MIRSSALLLKLLGEDIVANQAEELQNHWANDSRWKNVKRSYSAEDVVRYRGSVEIAHTLADNGAKKLWDLINNTPYVNSLGALTGNQAMQQVRAGLKAIYLSGWKSQQT